MTSPDRRRGAAASADESNRGCSAGAASLLGRIAQRAHGSSKVVRQVGGQDSLGNGAPCAPRRWHSTAYGDPAPAAARPAAMPPSLKRTRNLSKVLPCGRPPSPWPCATKHPRRWTTPRCASAPSPSSPRPTTSTEWASPPTSSPDATRRARQVPQELQKRSANVGPPTVVNDQTVLARGQEGLGDTGADALSAERG